MKLAVRVNRQYQEARAERRLAQQPEERYCRIKDKKVTVIVVYPDYRNFYDKGEPGDMCCSNIIDCYSENVKCRYSGISPLYPDPFSANN